MSQAFSLIFTYDDSRDSRPDDVLTVRFTDTRNSYRVVYKSGDWETRTNVVHMSYGEVQRHVRNILNSLTYDTDPFERVQVFLPAAPSVFYHVSDLDNEDVRDLIYDMIEDAMDADLEVEMD
jgi:hypothetical protein